MVFAFCSIPVRQNGHFFTGAQSSLRGSAGGDAEVRHDALDRSMLVADVQILGLNHPKSLSFPLLRAIEGEQIGRK